LLPAFDGLALARPEVKRQGKRACIQQVAVFKHLVVLVIVGVEPQGARLDAHVDVLGHQHDFARHIFLAQRLDHAKDLVVSLALRQAHRQGVVEHLGLEKQAAAGFRVPGGVQLQALADVGTVRPGEPIERTAGLARIAGHFRHAFLVAVKFFQHDHWQKNIVFLKAEQAHWVVHEDIGVENEEFGLA